MRLIAVNVFIFYFNVKISHVSSEKGIYKSKPLREVPSRPPWEEIKSGGFFFKLTDDCESVSHSNEGGGNKQDRSRKIPSTDFEDESDGKAIFQGTSLAFVFDSTGSMGDELSQVKAGATKILAALRDHPDSPIYNYIWVPFNDPAIGPVTLTRNPQEFQSKMNDVIASGGGDCPEMSIGAIKLALECSLPHSYIYVFTDAPPKDFILENEVLSLVQQKRAQVVFVLTEGCQDPEHDSSGVYERIAETSSGQIYKLNTEDFKEVLKYVKVALQSHVVSLLALNMPLPDKSDPDKLEVVIDESLKQFTVSISGTNAAFNVTNPEGVIVADPPKLEHVLDLANVKVVNLIRPDPGTWNIFITSDSNYTVRSTGVSKINFRHGFSTANAFSLKETNYRPLKGAKSYVLVEALNIDQAFNMTTLDFVGLDGNLIDRLPLSPVERKPGLYKTESFLPPNEFFYLGVSGFDRHGLPIKRITSTAISPQPPERPIVTVKSKIMGRINAKGTITCHVQSVVPFTVHWFKDNKYLGKQQTCSETCEVILHFENLTLQSNGIYTCTAQNIAGHGQGILNLNASEDAPLVVVKTPVISSPGQRVQLNCPVKSTTPFNVTWYQFTAKNHSSEILQPYLKEVALTNNTLLIESVNVEDEGWYVCIGRNEWGQSEGKVMLVVKEPLTVTVEPRNIWYVKGDSVTLRCTVSGKIPTTLRWLKDQQSIKDVSMVEVEEMKGRLNLELNYLDKRHAGTYSCNAAIDEESATASAELIYGKKPKVKATRSKLMAEAGSHISLECEVTGEPTPNVTWYKEGKNVHHSDRLRIGNNRISINASVHSDSGKYACVAENDKGVDMDYISLTVGSAPSFLEGPHIVEVELNQSETILCSVYGEPVPEITWTRENEKEFDKRRMLITTMGNLKITQIRYEDDGKYICAAKNAFGTALNAVTLKVTGAGNHSKATSSPNSTLKGKVGDKVIIPCLAEGNSFSRAVWTKDGLPLANIFQDERGRLILKNLTEDHSGIYTCTGMNEVGPKTQNISLQVQVPPSFTDKVQRFRVNVIEGHTVVLNCDASGTPQPQIKWYKNEKPLFSNEEEPKILRFLASLVDAGMFKCTATNEAGSSTRQFSVTILVPPKVVDLGSEESLRAKAGVPITLTCHVTGIPKPSILWQRNGLYLTRNTSDITISQLGLLTIKNVSKESAGAYTCDAENLGGIIQKTYYLQVNYPPIIVKNENDSKTIILKEGSKHSLGCITEGNPKPNVIWRKNGIPLYKNQEELTVLEDNTLMILSATKATAGIYKCEAFSTEGFSTKEYEILVLPLFSDSHTKKMEVNEGDTLMLSCPTKFPSPSHKIQWMKNGEPLDHLLRERADEAQMKLSKDHTTLIIDEAHPSDRGNYSCIATSLTERTRAGFFVDVLMTPHFEEFNHIAHRTILTGGEVVLNCSVSGNPQPKVIWRKENISITTHDTPGVQVSLDKNHLIIENGRVHHTGTYICLATNKVDTKEREFYITVLEPPHIFGPPHQKIDVRMGDTVTLLCISSGVPPPTFSWFKGRQFEMMLKNTQNHLEISSVNCSNIGIYQCQAANSAGTRTKYFEVNLMEKPKTERQEMIVGKVDYEVDDKYKAKCKVNEEANESMSRPHNEQILMRVKKSLGSEKCQSNGRGFEKLFHSAPKECH